MMRSLVFALGLVAATPSMAATAAPLSAVGVDQRINSRLRFETALVDEQGRAVRAGDYFGRLPVVLVFAYFHCRNLCGLLLTNSLQSLRDTGLEAGRGYQLVVVDIDERETPTIAAEKKNAYVHTYGRDYMGEAHFLTGRGEESRRLAASAGFRYAFDDEADEYVHPAGFLVATPDGRISRYFLGIRFDEVEVRDALQEAARSRTGRVTDRIWLLCHRFDPRTGRYTSLVIGWLQAIATLFLAALAGGVYLMRRRRP